MRCDIMDFKKGHYYKRTYQDGDYIVFLVISMDTSFLYISVINSNVEKINRNLPNYKHVCKYFKDTKTVKLTHAEVLAIAM